MRASILSPELRLPHWIDLNILWPQHGCQRMGYAAGDPVIIAFSGKCHSVLGKSTKIDQDWPNIMSKNYKQKKKSFIKRVENPQGELFGNRYIKIHAVDLIIVIQPLILVSSSSYVRRPLPPAENIILDFRHPLPRRDLLHTEVLWLVPQLVICRTFIGRIHFKLRFISGFFLKQHT